MTDSYTSTPPFDDPCIVAGAFDVYGGAEVYLLRLAEVLDAPIYTIRNSVDPDRDVQIHEFDTTRTTDLLLSAPFSDYFEAVAYQNFEVPEKHDAVITSSAPAMQIVHRPEQHRYHLMHEPERWLYGRLHEGEGTVGWPDRLFQSSLRRLYHSASHRIDDFIVNSEVTARNLETYYNRSPSEILHPPIDTDTYTAKNGDGYLLYLGRLDPRKRVGEIIAAVENTDATLKIAGTGELEHELKDKASDQIEFHGFVSEAEKKDLLANASGLVFNAESEPFGIVPIEALASGTPVIGVQEGFTQYQIDHLVTGVTYPRGVENLTEAITTTLETDWDIDALQSAAAQYDVEQFRETVTRIFKE